MGSKTKRFATFKRTVLGTALIFVATEAGVRLSGLTDFPIYASDKGVGYIPKPNQAGKFLHENSWVFNDRSMGTENHWDPTRRPNVLLIGNSIVIGGNPYSQKNKLGSLIQHELGYKYAVWPIAAGGWSNVNETTYFEKNPDVSRAADFFVWEYMSGGLSRLNRWQGEYVFPTKKPGWATWYVLRRYVLPRLIEFDTNELPPMGGLEVNSLARFDSTISKLSSASGNRPPGILLLYPDRAQLLAAENGVEWLPERSELEKLTAKYGLRIVDIARRPEWNGGLYRDDTHPTSEGNAVLARILTHAITDAISH